MLVLLPTADCNGLPTGLADAESESAVPSADAKPP